MLMFTEVQNPGSDNDSYTAAKNDSLTSKFSPDRYIDMFDPEAIVYHYGVHWD